MARMIPRTIGDEVESNAEKKLFRLFSALKNSDDWTVLHSVGIAKHVTQSRGECDFVVLVPGRGVFCLEVKGGAISYEDGEWYSQDRYGEYHPIQNPAKEAENAMDSFLKFMKEHGGNGTERCLFGYGVVFPDSEFHGRYALPDLADEQIADINDMDNLYRYISRLSNFWKERSKFPMPTVADCKAIVRILRPEFDAKISLLSRINANEKMIDRLTTEQKDIFDGLRDNDRCLIKGGAGTGKTLLAINFFKETVKTHPHSIFFCYNELLSEYLKAQVAGAEVHALHVYMEQYVCKNSKKQDIADVIRDMKKKGELYYREILPDLFMEAFVDDCEEPLDYLVLDEAQDLISEKYLDVFDLILKGGLQSGKWYFFIDAVTQTSGQKEISLQNIFQKGLSFEEQRSLLKERAFYANYKLSRNCRNSVEIVKQVDEWFGLNTSYRDEAETGVEVRVKKFSKTADEAKLLFDILDELQSKKVAKQDIVVLAPNKFENSVVSHFASNTFTDDPSDRENAILFSTVQRFKGLESKAVILTDFSSARNAEEWMKYLYVGMTRAKSVLYVLINEKAYETLNHSHYVTQ